jgi:hypothetical protein
MPGLQLSLPLLHLPRRLALRWLRHGRDWRFLALVALACLAIALQLAQQLDLAQRQGSSWRTLDLKALERRIDSGDLSAREADWYHPAQGPTQGSGGSPAANRPGDTPWAR